MKKQVAKSKIFNRESLTELQDKMRTFCIKSYNKYYEKNSILKQKQKGRNQDIKVKDMEDYREIKNQIAKKEEKLQEANNQTQKLDIASNNINEILNNLKPTKLNKNNMIISSENVEIIKNYTESVKDTTKTIRNVNDLNMAIRDFEHSAFEVQKENRSLKYELELKDDEIGKLKSENSKKDKIINKLQTEKESLKQQLQKFKGFWHKTIKYFQDKINYNGDKNFIEVAKDLFINKIFDNHEYEIVNDRRKKVKTIDEIQTMTGKKKNNMELKQEMNLIMENENVKDLINMIDKMDIKDKLRLAICMSQDKWSGLKFNTKENYEKFDTMLKSIDEEYRTTNINMEKYFNIMFAEAKLMESPVEQQNQVALYLFNSIKL